MTSEKTNTTQLARLDSYGEHYPEILALDAEVTQLHGELTDLIHILLAHEECCDASQICTHSVRPPYNSVVRTKTT
ncbi:hypothetical protein B0J13DRAFT_458498 [Dactylonectria estremocensis]|uniref:Uncharacterized protein n=1 Tax=Dactylonectria estremocensis TaxID=1079267 RepID=A0A9P9DFV0_9HYPO|nr:hypothetical protein B0J13DRAFT_458498 [Dactylonectria estremocensis]